MHYKQYKTILSPQNGMNLYRGCTHGCIYCDSRSVCYQMDHDFEDIEIKENSDKILEEQLKKKRYKGMISTGSMCDPYIPLEKQLRITRRSLEIIEKYGFGVTVLTKSASILSDLDILKRINEKARAVIQMTLTTADEELCKIVEPYVSSTRQRVEALHTFHQNDIPTVVWMTPFLPFINDTEDNLMKLLNYCLEANVKGIIFFGISLTLREGDREYFYQKLDEHFPGVKEKYIKTYGNKYEILSKENERLSKIFHDFCEEHHILHFPNQVFSYLREFQEKKTYEQLSLF